MKIELVQAALDPFDWLQSYQIEQSGLRADFGATSIFIGTMRDFNEGGRVESMFLEHYPAMTAKKLTQIAQQAIDKWHILDIAIAHRVGHIHPADTIVCVAVWSTHRRQAYEANRMVMEALKSSAPFWKKEQRIDGPRWVEKNTEGF